MGGLLKQKPSLNRPPISGSYLPNNSLGLQSDVMIIHGCDASCKTSTVRDVEVKSTSNEFVIKPLHDSTMQWEYEPATFNGHPSLGLVQVKVN
jgi:hypothetical protein